MAESAKGKMKRILRSFWLPERARWTHLARSRFPRWSKENQAHLVKSTSACESKLLAHRPHCCFKRTVNNSLLREQNALLNNWKGVIRLIIEELEQMCFEKHDRKIKEKMTTKSTADRIRVEDFHFLTLIIWTSPNQSNRDRLIWFKITVGTQYVRT